MNRLSELTRAALSGDALATRSVLQDWMASHPRFDAIERPLSDDQTAESLAAGLAELLAHRFGQTPPAWTSLVGPAPQPTHLLRSAATMPRLRKMCESESPAPLKSRNFFAPANYLEFK